MNNNISVIVAGAGPAGIGAALRAAREGSSVLLIEQTAFPGGQGTGAKVCCFGDNPGGPVFDEITGELLADIDARYEYKSEKYLKPGRIAFNSEMYKILVMKKLYEAGVKVLFNTFCREAYIENGKVKGVYVVNKSGRSLIKGKIVIDATGDADIAESAGVEFEQGDPKDRRIQHVNFKAVISDIDHSAFTLSKTGKEDLADLFSRGIKNGLIHP
ncbi:MAG TPA: hypothetical protein DC049_11235, partial [Spirochaetia bacterium]|nr:hypothetical protein [Spirochaetia bacterium]